MNSENFFEMIFYARFKNSSVLQKAKKMNIFEMDKLVKLNGNLTEIRSADASEYCVTCYFLILRIPLNDTLCLF